MNALLVAHAAATWAMVGLIWMVQVVHYPLFADVGPDRFTRYEARHRARISWVVGPLMGVEGVTALVLVVHHPGLPLWLPLVGIALLGVIHASTVFLQVPDHERLSGGWDPGTGGRLVRTNWIRTAGWTARGAVAAAMLLVVLPG